MKKLFERSATDQAAAVRRGEVSARELVAAHLERIERFNPAVNAVVTVDAESALAEAGEADSRTARGVEFGPLHGVPLTVKDTFDTAGMKTTYISPLHRKHVPTRDATVVGRLRDAGAILIGKTNLPVAAYDWQTSNPMFGRTRNPWNLDHTVGGSSGGSAASLAAGFAALEVGSDVAGSIRVPSHFCGVAGLRPTEGRLSNVGGDSVPGMPRVLRNLVAVGPMARRVADLAPMLHVMDGPDSRDWRIATPPPSSPPPSLKGLRVAFAESFGGVVPDTETRRVLHGFLKELEGLGCRVKEETPDISFEEAFQVWGQIQMFEFFSFLPFPLREVRWFVYAGGARLLFGPGGFSKSLARGASTGPRGYFRALTRRDEFVAKMDGFMSRHDLWITPVAATPAFKHRRRGKSIRVDDRKTPYGLTQGMFNCPTALLAHPILSMPVSQSSAGLPVGLQLHGRRWSDHALLAVGAEIESRRETRPVAQLK